MASNSFPVAVIGMAVKLPGAESCEEYWKLILEGRDTVGEFPSEREADISHVLPFFQGHLIDEDKPFFTGSFFKSVDKFDADLFQINPKEAMFIEPQQRLFLETAWKLLEDAGYASCIRGKKTGVYVGNTTNKYKLVLTENHPSISHGNHSPFVSSRVSYTLDLTGPAMMVATGCSSSLLAVHLACQGLLSGDCDMAVAGGITIDLLPISTNTDIWNQLGITGPKVKCRAFDACAKGIAKGEGCGAVLLKPLEQALSDGDHVYGILQATTANQDGHSNGITAPHPVAQAKLLHQAWELADIKPDRLGYFEAHGTGTELGDPIEISGITKAFKMSGVTWENENPKIPIGSVKANIGHLADGAAGVVALIKTLLCMNYGKIPPAVNFSKANPHINWQKAPVYVNTSPIDWKPNADKSPRFASVSAFGLLGTNVHAVVKEHTPLQSATLDYAMTKSKQCTVLVLAAVSRESLLTFVQHMIGYFERSDNKSLKHLQNVCFTINTGREQEKFEARAIAYGENWDEMTQELQHLHENLRQISSNERKIRISAGFDNKDSNCTTAIRVKEEYLNGKAIQWNKVYSGHSLCKVPFLPTYAFDKVRYWPKKGEPVNSNLLHLEHHLAQFDGMEETSGCCDADKCQKSSKHASNNQSDVILREKCQKQNPNSSQPEDAGLLLSEALNEALGREYDWTMLKDENLFSLGVDSLICTHVNMRIKDELGLNAEAFTMTDLHLNPSFGRLIRVIQTKITPSSESDESTSSSSLNITTATEGLYPLSFAQKRLWVMQEIALNPCAYNVTNCLKITGQFHPAAFVQSANAVLSRHGAFFTVFANTPNGLFQTHNWNLPVKVDELDYRASGDISEDSAMKEYEEDYKTPFDLELGPLVRCKLYSLSEDQYLFTMVSHHIVFDGWSHFNLYNELWHTYRNVCDGVVEHKPIHKPLYAELVSVEQNEVKSVSASDLAYWKQKLCGPLPLTTLPGDKRRPPVFSYNGGRITRFIDNDVVSNLAQLIGDEYTLYMALVATVFSLLRQYTGEDDLLIGTPVAGRYDIRSKAIIGCFVNTVVLRLQLKGELSFREILESVSKVCLEAYDHQQAPFDLLVSELSLPRDTSITPIFSINVCYHNTEVNAEHASTPSDLQVSRKLLHNNSSKWDMQFDFLQEEEGMRFTLEYYSDVYSTTYAECVAENFVNLLNRVARDKSALILPVIPVSEVSNPLSGLASDVSVLHGATRDIGEKTLPNLLIESMCDYADEGCIIDTDGKRSLYREVLKKAGQIAVFLREKCQIQSQSRIGLLLNNSIESLVSILACLLSGLVYVPLNCDDPKHRLEHICNEAEVAAIIFSKSSLSLANNLLWACQSLSVLFCADEENFEELLENHQEAPLMDKELWDYTASDGEDDIDAGGWKSSYTGENFSETEMDEYAENILKKLKQYIKPNSRILEIGCASGLTTKKLYPLVGRYVATDLSQAMTDRLSNALKESKTVEFVCVPAHQVGQVFQGQEFDIIILNSVVHCFPGHNYLRKVMDSCGSLLQENGIIFVGDIMDLEKKDKLVWKFKSFKASNPCHRTKTEWQSELFLSRKCLQHLCNTSPSLKSVSFSPKIFTLPNELTEFRFDAIFSKSTCPKVSDVPKVDAIMTCANGDLPDALRDMQDSDITALTRWSREVGIADEAYVLYTSGTTGTPKGVIIGHEALLNYVLWASAAYRLNKDSSLPLFSPLTFDFTVTSILPPLLNGSTIRIFKSFQDSYQDLARCPELTTVKFSPLQLDTVLSATDGPLSASIFIVGGEELTSELLRKLKRNKGNEMFEVWNEYGPTEATVGCVAKCFSGDDLPLDMSEYVTIGKPIDNVTIAVTRDRTNHVPLGGKGKLCIGGKCLCLDFAGKGSTKEAKMNKSFEVACWGDPGELMLVTDDIAGVIPGSKEIAYYGREESNTAKVYGVRVDLMEIQRAIESHHLVHSAWVSSFTYSNYTYLGAAVKLNPTTTLQASNTETWKQELISSLTKCLPSRCIPKVMVSISDPPINSNGKKDTLLLRGLFEAELQSAMEISDRNISDMGGISATDASKLQFLWQSILPCKGLPGLDGDFFFDLSGDSLQAIHLVRKMRNEGYQVSVEDIFRNPTIRKLLKALQENTGDLVLKHTSAKEEIQKFRPTPIIEEFLKRDHKNADYFALSSLLRFEGKLETSILKVALRSIMDKHCSLRSKFEIVEGVAVQEVLNLQPNEPTIKEINLSCKEEHLVNDPAFLDLCQSLEQSHSLSEGILLNAGIITLSKKEDNASEGESTYVLLVVHHIAIDIVSWQQVLEDLATSLKMLNDIEGQEHVELRKCLLPFSNFCNALQEQVNGIFGEEITYWKEIETQCAESGFLNKEQCQSTFKSAKWLSRSFDVDTLRTMSARLKCSDEHILLTILGRALSFIHGKDKTAIVLESHGRQLPDADSSSTVGWCTSMFPFVLEVSQKDHIQKQVHQIKEKVKQIPHRGLGFGLLKAEGKITIPLPNIMFVFQGSLDVSSKLKFDGGKHKFEHVPWIEVMQTELTQRRFHRHPEEILEFDLEVIAWIHGGQLKIGCLFDTKNICESLVDKLLDHALNDLKVLAKELNCSTKVIAAEIIPFFNITPDCIQTAKDALMEHGIQAEKVLVFPPDQALQSMIKSADKKSDVTVIISRHTTENQADEFRNSYTDFLEERSSNKVIMINGESLPNSVKLPVEIVQLDGNIVQIPSTFGQAYYDKLTDVQYDMPLTQEGYSQIGLIIARSIRAMINGNKYKVIAVDADYTLWEGECADGNLTINSGNICLQKFLLKKKREGMLLVILSKNSHQDVVKVFEAQRDQMMLKLDDFVEIAANWSSKTENISSVANQLNLSLSSFVFIDDSPLECEEMVTSHPEILTIKLPSNPKLVGKVVENLWSLDAMNVTKESSERTEMYRSESARKQDMDKAKKVDAAKREVEVTKLLAKWKMKLTFLKTNVSSVNQNKTLLKRAAELLHRTNQFKLNDFFTEFSDFQEEDVCWIVSLDDCHGSYGIVSVCVIDNTSSSLKQWVLSCRALGRLVESRILKEVYASFKEGLRLLASRTERNDPAIIFLERLGCSIGKTGLACVNVQDIKLLSLTEETLHGIEVVSDVTSFTEKIYSKKDTHHKDLDEYTKSDDPSIKEVNLAIEVEWSSAMKEQRKRHNLFPLTPVRQDTEARKNLDQCPFTNSRTQVLQSAWMEVLQSDQIPQSADNFLELGGNSFGAVFLVSKLQRALGIEISVTDVLQYPKYGDYHNLVLHAPKSNDANECKSINMRCRPISAAQQRMLIMQESAPDSTAYIETVALYTINKLCPSKIYESIIKQHPILKAKFEFSEERLCYVMCSYDKLDTHTELELVENLNTASEYLTQSIPCIKMISSPLVRFRHLEAGGTTVLVLHAHHAIVDEITLSNISKDLEKLVNGETLLLRPGKECCDKFGNLLEDNLSSIQYKSNEEYWYEKFKTLPPEANLAILPQSQALWKDTAVYKAGQSKFKIADDMLNSIMKYCHRMGITPFQYFLACSLIVLQRYLGVDEVTLAIPVTTRTDVSQHTDGLFVNTVLFRCPIDCSLTFKNYLKTVADRWLQTLRHAQYPLDELVKILMKEHNKGPSSFCCTMFNFTSQVRPANALEVQSKHAKMPLSLDVLYNEKDGTSEVVVEWALDLIDDGVAKRLADSMVNTFGETLKAPHTVLYNINALSPLEQKLVQSFSRCSEENITDNQPIQMLFEEHAAVNPDSTAICCNGSTVSYIQLNRMASSIACVLSEKFTQASLKSRPIVIVMTKDEYTIASILGIWKAGGHFLPVASNMQSVLQQILKRCKPLAVIFNVLLEVNYEACPMIDINVLVNHPPENFLRSQEGTNGNDPAYIIRTSGSTGKPKQCKISHKSLKTISQAWTKKYQMENIGVRVLQWAPISFDVFIGDVVRALVCTSGRLIICPDQFRLDVPHILDLIKKHHITMAEVTPQFGLQLVENSAQDELTSLRLLILGSDVLQNHVFQEIKSAMREEQRVINSYGMTEATVDSSFYEGPVISRTRSGTVPIGKPLPGVRLHILDTKTHLPCPVGTIGELFISGNVLALGDVEITQLNETCLALKTGDSACWLPSGDVDLIGRLDNVVKLRGFRISTHEIENKIAALVKGIRGAYVVTMLNEVDQSHATSEYLCAFLVLDNNNNEEAMDFNAIRQQLRGHLPYYMVPDIFHVIDRAPLSAHGKIDLLALPSLSQLLELNSGMTTNESSSNLSATAALLKELLGEALGLPDSSMINPELTFMELGAHSLILIQLSSLIKQKSSFDVKIADLFSYPTITDLAEYIDHGKNAIHLVTSSEERQQKEKTQDNIDEEIAITGIGIRLPSNVSTLAEFWKILDKGEDVIREFPEQRSKDVTDTLDDSSLKKISSNGTFKGAFLEQIEMFDNHFFKIAPGEAKYMSPEQRLFLQVATEALAEGNGLSESKGAKVGVFVGSSEIGYAHLSHPDDAVCISGLLPGMIATRVAYQWDLKGPTMLIDTACSSSLMALKTACESIRNCECEGALVGGVSLVLYPSRCGVFGQTSILSEDFHCRAFDRDASGTAVGEGVMCLYVEPISKAIKEGKSIYGLIKGFATNSVGHGNGITAPTAVSQQMVIQDALKAAKVLPSDISFLEAHGTGTNLGDRIELSALSAVFGGENTDDKLPIGSVKTVFGHLDSAAGMISVIKILASFMAKKICPTANFNTPNRELENSQMYVPSKSVPWETKGSNERIAGISSFGLTGTNCHVILQECNGTTECQQSVSSDASLPLLLSGRSIQHILKQISKYEIFLKESADLTTEISFLSFCVTIARRLKDLSDAKVGHNHYRMAITGTTTEKVLNIMEIANSFQDTKDLAMFVSLRKDVHLYGPEHTQIHCQDPFVIDFLLDGTIELDGLFSCDTSQVKSAKGVAVAMYEEERLWLDPCARNILLTGLPGLVDLLQKKIQETRELTRTLPLSPTEELSRMQGRFCAALIIKFLKATEVKRCLHDGKEMSLRNAFLLTGMHVRYEKLFFVMIRELSRNHLVRAVGCDESLEYLDSFKFECDQVLDPGVIANAAVEKFPPWADCFRFPLYCSQYYQDVLVGNMSPLSVIYPQGNLNFMFQFDKLGDLLGDVYYNMYMQIIAEYAKHLSSQGKAVRVLEVGAGVGYVTRQLLPKMKDIPNIEYWFTDLGKAFVENAKTLFPEYLHMMKLATFDITKSASKQGILGSFDIVISYNVIHTTESIIKSVVNLKSCLGKEGTLFIIESARNDTWATLAWGLLDGWWYFKDYDLRSAEPMMEVDKWEAVLKDIGFSSIFTCPINEDERRHVEKCLFVCSNKVLKSSQMVGPGWWECEANIFHPYQEYNDPEDMGCLKNGSDPNEEANDSNKEIAVYEELKMIWSQLLGIDNINFDDDFNSLGGESLLAIQMMRLVRHRIGFQLEIADTFGYPTLGNLAAFIAENLTENLVAELPGSAPQCDSSTTGASKLQVGTTSRQEGNTSGMLNVVPAKRLHYDHDNKVKGTRTMIMFPGQGSQKRDMCISMKDSPEARAVFSRAQPILGYNVLELFLGNDEKIEEKLKSTEFVQVSLFLSCLAKVEQVKVERPDLIDDIICVAGLSVGEFAALVYSGVMSFQDALHIVRERGKAMEKEVRCTASGMVSILGPTSAELEVYLEEKFPNMKISTYLADKQHTVAGREEDCLSLVEALSSKENHSSVADVRKLRVAGGFHSEYMRNAENTIAPLIQKVCFSKPSIPIIMNVNAEIVEDPQEIQRLVCQQLISPVQWRNTVIKAYELGVRNFVEIAPARVLSSIVKNRIEQCKNCTTEMIKV